MACAGFPTGGPQPPQGSPPRAPRAATARAANGVISRPSLSQGAQLASGALARGPTWYPLRLTISFAPSSPSSTDLEATLEHVPLLGLQPEPALEQQQAAPPPPPPQQPRQHNRRQDAVVLSTRARRDASVEQRGLRAKGPATAIGVGIGDPDEAELRPGEAQAAARRVAPAEERKLSKAVQLSRRVEKAASAYAVSHGRPPTASELAEELGFPDGPSVEGALRKGWAARQRLVDANRGLVVYLALKLRNQGLDLADLIAEGMAALDLAVGSFRPDREGARLSTFAGTAVYRNMLRAVHNYGRVVPIPVRMHQAMVQVRKAQQSLQVSLGRAPTHGELAAATGLEESEVLRLQQAFRQPGPRPLGAGGAGDAEQAGEWDDRDLLATDPEDWAQNNLVTSGIMLDLAAGLQALKPSQRQAVTLRHGLHDSMPRTWREVGEEMQLTHQRVQKIHAAAIEELRRQLSG